MSYNNHMYAIDRDDVYLAHYGVKGMHWGVQKLARDVQRAVNSGNARRYSKLYQKAQRKLAKYQKQATSGDKYKRRAALLGAGALATGGVAVGGVGGINKAIDLGARLGSKAAKVLQGKPGFRQTDYSKLIRDKGAGMHQNLSDWGRATPFSKMAEKRAQNVITKANHDVYGEAVQALKAQKKPVTADAIDAFYKKKYPNETAADRLAKIKQSEEKANRIREAGKMTNNEMLRVGSALASAGLGAAAGYNAYRAATTKRAARKADEWQRAINENFGPQKTTRRTKKRNRG